MIHTKNYRTWRNVLSLVLAAISVIGCQENEPASTNVTDTSVVEARVSMAGQVAVERTRAMGVADVDIVKESFSVIGYRTDSKFTDNITTTSPSLLHGVVQKVAVDTKDNKFKINLPASQPAADSKISFFAWTQTTVTGSTDGITNYVKSADSRGWPWLDVSVAAAGAAQVDVVAAAAVNVNNEYVPNAVDLDFKHILSKLTFKAKTVSGATIKLISAKIVVPSSTVYRNARFTYDASDSLGVWGAYGKYYDASEQDINHEALPSVLTTTPQPIGEVMFIPQTLPSDKVKICLKYTITSGAGVSQNIERETTIKRLDMRQNRNYVYTLNVGAEGIEFSDSRISDWVESGVEALPIIPGPRGNVILLLDGYDAPYEHTDGKKYWLDRSGYNRHCEIFIHPTGGTITHDNVNKCYNFAAASNQGIDEVRSLVMIPDLGSVSYSTVELIARKNSLSSSSDKVLGFSDDKNVTTEIPGFTQGKSPNRRWFVHLYQNGGSVVFDYNATYWATGTRLSLPPTQLSASKSSFYTFRRGSDGRQSVNIDAFFQEAKTGLTNNAAVSLKYGGLGLNFTGTVSYVKIMNTVLTDQQITDDRKVLKDKFRLGSIASLESYLPPVTSGLLFDMIPRYGVYTGKSDFFGVTPKSSGWITGTNISCQNSSRGWGVYFNGSSSYVSLNQIPDFFNNLTSNHIFSKECTVEFVADLDERGVNAQNSLLNLSSVDEQAYTNREIHVHYTAEGKMWVIMNKGREVLSFDWTSTSLYGWTIVKQGSDVTLYKDGSAYRTASSYTPLPTVSYGYLGCHTAGFRTYKGHIYLFRIYNRALTATEVAANHAYNKTFLNGL